MVVVFLFLELVVVVVVMLVPVAMMGDIRDFKIQRRDGDQDVA